jgi:hypothetical protein
MSMAEQPKDWAEAHVNGAGAREAADGAWTNADEQTSERSGSQSSKQARDYRETEHGIEWRKRTKEGGLWVQLTNFCAKIISDILCDDGVEVTRLLEIAATINGR